MRSSFVTAIAATTVIVVSGGILVGVFMLAQARDSQHHEQVVPATAEPSVEPTAEPTAEPSAEPTVQSPPTVEAPPVVSPPAPAPKKCPAGSYATEAYDGGDLACLPNECAALIELPQPDYPQCDRSFYI